MLTLLIIEDDLYLQKELSEFMENFFDSIVAVASAEDAFEWLNTNKATPPDLVLTDICLPKMNGLDFLRHFRKKDSGTMIAVMSAYPETDYLLESIELKIETFLVKPFDSQELISKMSNIAKKLRKNKPEEAPKKLYFSEEKWVDLESMQLYHNKELIFPGKKEQQLLELLITNRHQHLDEQTITHRLWPERATPSSTFRALVRRLRETIGSTDAIQNIRGYGYKLNFTQASQE